MMRIMSTLFSRGSTRFSRGVEIVLLLVCVPILLNLGGCRSVGAQGDVTTGEAPPEPKVTLAPEASMFTVEHPEQFPLATATERRARAEYHAARGDHARPRIPWRD